jgi:peroxiredoxin
MVTFRRLLVFLCLISVSFAQHLPRKAADIPIRTTDNKTIHISQYRNKVVVIVMMLTSCNDCLATLQFFSKMQTEWGPRGLQIVAISLDESAVNAALMQQRYRFPFPIAHLEKDGAIKLADLNATARPVVPYVMFVDWMGNVRFQYPADAPIFQSPEKNLRGIAEGLLRQAANKEGPHYETRPAGKQ